MCDLLLAINSRGSPVNFPVQCLLINDVGKAAFAPAPVVLTEAGP